jgi:hypothetical protein
VFDGDGSPITMWILTGGTVLDSDISGGLVYFYDESLNNGVILRDAIFLDTSINNGVIAGNGYFVDSSTNNGSVTGGA